MKKKLLLFLFIVCVVFLTGCSTDSMDNIEIVVTNYPNEYITKKLYGEHSTITSVYPDGVDISSYKVSRKQKHDYAKADLFIYNGFISSERDLAVDLLDINPDLKIIDASYALDDENGPEELWLNPSSLLMMSQNVRLGLSEYITSTYLQKDVDSAYDSLKIELSEVDADYRLAAENTTHKNIVVQDKALKFLESFGLNVYVIDNDTTDKTMSDVEELIDDGEVSYIMMFKGEDANSKVNKLLKSYPNLKKLGLNKLDNITDSERSNKEDYISLMNDNLENIKKELYQ